MIELGEVAVIGGGCYGSFYLGQLGKARIAADISWRRLLVIDRDRSCAAASLIESTADAELVESEWADFLAGWLGGRESGDKIVPSPLMPHLLAEWVADRAAERWPPPGHRVDLLAATEPVGTPYDELHPVTGVRYISHADWLCPVHCIEPAICPRIRAPRSWEMSATVEAHAAKLAADGIPTATGVFVCKHLTHGVGMTDATAPRAALDTLTELRARSNTAVRMLLGSVSSCHGALAVLSVSPGEPLAVC